jgi:hypothetical protein
VAALGAVALVASTTLGADERAWDPPPCAAPPDAAAARSGTLGSWFRLDPLIEAGERRGQRLSLGIADGADPWVVPLDAESFASGPAGDRVLVGTDDGSMSRLSLIDLRLRCRHAVAASTDVIRRATLAPDGATIYEFRVDRATRAELGVWRRDLRTPSTAVRVLPSIAPDARFGRTWSTELAWSIDGSRLAVQSCGESACRTRILDPSSGLVQAVADPDLGALVGLTRDRLVVHAACRGLPCPLVAVALADGNRTVLDPAAGLAAMALDADRESRVVYEAGSAAAQLRSVRPDGADARTLPTGSTAVRLVPGGRGAMIGVEVGPEWLALVREPVSVGEPAEPPQLRRPTDEPAVTLEEALR